MFGSENRQEFAQKLLIPIVEREVRHRKHINQVSSQRMEEGLKIVLGNIMDESFEEVLQGEA